MAVIEVTIDIGKRADLILVEGSLAKYSNLSQYKYRVGSMVS